MLDYKSLFNLKGKTVLVAGSSRGIGATLSNALKDNEAFVIGLSRKRDLSNNLNQHFKCDLTKRSDILKIFNLLNTNQIKIDVLIFAAGITGSNKAKNDIENFSKIIDNNLIANFNLIYTLKPILSKNSSVINISSINAIQGFPNNPGYVASKGGIEALTRGLAIDLSKQKIRVNCIRPGYIATDMTKESYSDKIKYNKRKNKTILKRWGNTKDLVGPALLLASDASAYMTGSIITVDGGWTALGLDL